MKFHELFNNKTLRIQNEGLYKIIQRYNFYNITDSIPQSIYNNFKLSKSATIDQISVNSINKEDNFFIICFKNTIISINQTSVKLLQDLFSSNSNLTIHFLSNSSTTFSKLLQIKNIISNLDLNFESEINNLSQKIEIETKLNHDVFKIWEIIRLCLSGYLIKESYEKTVKNRLLSFQNFCINNNKKEQFDEMWNESDYIELRLIYKTISDIYLVYHIEKEELFVVKKISQEKLDKREMHNYSILYHPLMSKYYGRVENNYHIIEYINGQTLVNIKQMNLTFEDKIKIIVEILLIIQYINEKKCIYRDLKPNNVMIDQNKTAVLIDFDEMIDTSIVPETEIRTNDFMGNYMAPEIKNGKLCLEGDIYSFGKMVYYIINEEDPKKDDIKHFEPLLEKIYESCIDDDINNRPKSYQIFGQLYFNFKKKVDFNSLIENPQSQYNLGVINLINGFNNEAIYYLTKAAKLKHLKAQYNLGVLFFESRNIIHNIDKAIYYFELAGNQDDSYALNNLGGIYLNEDYGKQDISKAISYLTRATELNNINASNTLGAIYYEGKYIKKDIKKAIHYLEIAANQNEPNALHTLGIIYEKGDSVEHNFQKAIYYYNCAAKLNNPNSLYKMGVIFYERKYVNKAIEYFELAAKLNEPDSLFTLGQFYYKGIHVPYNINKAIQYFSAAAENNNIMAQFYLGCIYEKGEEVKRDVDKAIYYFSLAAKQNDSESLYNLGEIYYAGKDINKAIKYFTQAAEKNNHLAQYRLGKIYLIGKDVIRDINKAIKYFKLAGNLKEALSYLGEIYFTGEYIKPDINQAIHYLQLASDLNDYISQYYLGIFYSNNKDFNKAIHYFQLAADQNCPNALNDLALIYLKGEHVKQDIRKAIHYLQLAADKNEPVAQYNLADLYVKGKYVERNINKAIKYFTLAAKQNFVKAQFRLGVIYYEGFFITKDIKRAIYYFQLAANQNHPYSLIYLGYIYNSDKKYSEAIHYLEKAVKQNDPSAQFYLGSIYEKGEIVKRDINKALKLYELAAKQNDPDALCALGMIYDKGEYVKNDPKKAIHYYTISANQHQPNSQYRLGVIYLTGTYVQKDVIKGLDLLRMAECNGNNDASFTLGFVYYQGIDVERDIQKAIKYYKELSSLNNQFAKNNLGIIYMNGIKSVEKNLKYSTTLFKEAISQKTDVVSMYNLAHIYLYEKAKFDKSIKLLIQSTLAKEPFIPSKYLLSVALLKKCGMNWERIKEELNKYTDKSDILLSEIKRIIDYDNHKKINRYEYMKHFKYIYGILHEVCDTITYNNADQNIKKNQDIKDITESFYEGFGNDL